MQNFQKSYKWDRGLKIFNFGDLTKSLEIADFSDFEETFRSECRERNERRGAESGAEAGVPSGVAGAEDGATRSEWSERNEWRKRLEKPENISDLNKDFCDDHRK